MNELIIMYDEEEPQRVTRRVQSSRTSGDYWFSLPEEEGKWGMNNAPFNPLFSVESSRFYRIKVVEELSHILRWYDSEQLPVLLPTTQRDKVLDFIETFESPIALAVGWCAINPWHEENRAPHRVSEFFVFDQARSVDLHRARLNAFHHFESEAELREGDYSQGHLTFKFADVDCQGDFVGMSASDYLVVFNHLIRVSDHRGGETLTLRVDNKGIIFNISQNDIIVDIISYDHDKVGYVLKAGQAMIFSHPFPSDGVD